MFRIIASQKEQIQNFASMMKSINPSVYVPPTNEVRLWKSVEEALKMYRGTKTGEVIGRVMAGQSQHKICDDMGMDQREFNMHMGYFYLDFQNAYKRKMSKEDRKRIKKGWF